MRTVWEGIVTEAVGHLFAWPEWLDRPALGRIRASSPATLRSFRTYNRGKPYAQQVKPANFLLTAYVRRFGHPEGVDPAHFHLVATFESDPRKWPKLPWMNLYDEHSTRYRIASEYSDYVAADRVQVKTYGDVRDDYRAHPEAKSLAPDGAVCRGSTVGVLQRRPVTARYLSHVGKESNRLEEVEAGLVHDPDEVYTEYIDEQHDPTWEELVAKLRAIPRSWLMQETGLARSTITALRNGHARPTRKTREKLQLAVQAASY
jgi:hypothetical protein